jgi:uncharacterized protein YbjQ (UPF0145 family)
MTLPGPGAGLPATTRARLAAIKASGTWDSTLSAEEFAAIRAVGFEPAGQAFGAAVYKVGFPGGSYCPQYYRRALSSRSGSMRLAPQELTRGGPDGIFGPFVRSLFAARTTAIGRMAAECAALGGHGVVGVSLTSGEHPGGWIEFTAIGTAIRGLGRSGGPVGQRLKSAFTAAVTGQDFAKLIMAGFVPVRVVVGIAVGVRHDDWLARKLNRRLASKLAGSVEVDCYTELVNQARQDARKELRHQVSRVGGQGVLLHRMDMRIGEYECPALETYHDYWAEVSMIGTAIAQFASRGLVAGRPSLAVLSLGPGRRRAARVHLGQPGGATAGLTTDRLDELGLLPHVDEEQGKND